MKKISVVLTFVFSVSILNAGCATTAGASVGHSVGSAVGYTIDSAVGLAASSVKFIHRTITKHRDKDKD